MAAKEMKVYLGMILMGILKLPRLEMYWSMQHPLVATCGLSKIMSREQCAQVISGNLL